MRLKVALLALASAAFFATPALASDPVLDANQTGIGNGGLYVCDNCGTIWYGQPFTAQNTGSIVAVDVVVSSFGSPNQPLKVTIERADSRGVPTGEVLGSASILPEQLQSDDRFVRATFQTPARAVAGGRYAFRLRSASTSGYVVWVLGTSGAWILAYDGTTREYGSLAYRVWVTPGAAPDTTAPVLSGVPGNVAAEATSAAGAVVTYQTPTATDDVDGAVTTACSPTSATAFALGTTTVHCTATDAAGNTATAAFTVKVTDTTAPVLSGVPGNVAAEATSAGGAVVTYQTPTATDDVDGAVTTACSPASATAFALGTTTVHCTATDAAGNTATAAFTVKVTDTTAPVLTLPAAVTVDAASPSGAVVAYTASASDLVDGATAVTCAPASGSTFAVGTTTVSCSTVDTRGNTAVGTFTVTVRSPAEMLAALQTAVDAVGSRSLARALESVERQLDRGNVKAAKVQLRVFMLQVSIQAGRPIPTAQANALLASAQALLKALG
jgi:hypothetical protein